MQQAYMTLAEIRQLPVSASLFWWWKDKHGAFQGASRFTAQHLLDIAEPEALLGKTDVQTAASDYADQFRDHDEAVIRQGCTQQFLEYTCGGADNRQRQIVVSKFPVRHKQPSPIGVFGMAVFLPSEFSCPVSNANQVTATHYYYANKNQSWQLTPRESHCLYQLIQHPAFTYAEIGELLHISKRTVESYIDSIKMKLHVSTRSDIVVKAFSLGWDRMEIV